MANEAYRAVFLRVHPTGKMVLSLTTESDGREAEYAQTVAGQLGVPPLDVKVVPADTARCREGHGINTRRGCSPARRSMHLPTACSGTTARLSRATAATAATPGRSPTSPCTRTAPVSCHPASRAASMRKPSTATD